MKKNEVGLWLKYHASIFPGWKYAAGESTEARNIAFVAIAKALFKTELQDAKEASDRMLAGTIKKPFNDCDHIAAIVAACRAIEAERKPRRSFMVDGRETFTCPHCQGFGAVVVKHPDYEPRGVAIDCLCQPERGRVRYDPERMERRDPLPLPDDDVPYHARTRQYAANIGSKP